MSRRVLCLDPGFAWLGWAIVAAGKEVDTLVAMGFVRTDKSDNKRGVRRVDDNFRRAQEIAEGLREVSEGAQAIAFEAYSPVRSSSVAAQLGHSYGIVAMLSVMLSVPVVSATPAEVRKRVGASKELAEDTVRRHFRSPRSLAAIEQFERTYKKNKSNHNHAWDACAVYLACRDSEVLRALRFL